LLQSDEGYPKYILEADGNTPRRFKAKTRRTKRSGDAKRLVDKNAKESMRWSGRKTTWVTRRFAMVINMALVATVFVGVVAAVSTLVA
jgi:hypothetical protein